MRNVFSSTPFFKYTGGHIGVVLFFVLSGFLITTLLMKEKKKRGQIDLKSFYARRILRVWPLFYLIIALSYVLFEYNPSSATVALCLTIFPNIAFVLGIGWSASPQIWSIGVEEQFYAIWPLVVRSGKWLLTKLVIIFCLFSLLPHVLSFVLVRIYPNQEIMNLVYKLSTYTEYQCLAVGGITGVAFTRNWFRNLKLKNGLSWILVIIPFILWFLGVHLNRFNSEFYAILFGVAILLITTQLQHSIIEPKVFKFIGKVSYGVYMYHWIILKLIVDGNFLPKDMPTVYISLLYLTTISATLLVSSISYHLLELRFLNLKKRFDRE